MTQYAIDLNLKLNCLNQNIKEKKTITTFLDRLLCLRKNRVENSLAEDFIKLYVSLNVDDKEFDTLFMDNESNSKFMQKLRTFDGFKLLQDQRADGLDGDLGLVFLTILACVKATSELKIAFREYFMTPYSLEPAMKKESVFHMLDDNPILELLNKI